MWTSQLSAQLSCRAPNSQQHFNNLQGVTTLQAEKWQDHLVYALFSNGCGMSAVCVYKMGDIDHIFTTSSFKGYKHENSNERPGMCVDDSKKLTRENLMLAQKLFVMKDSVRPLGQSAVLVSHHHYTHIHVDRVRDQHTVLFLSLYNGAIHKVLETNSEAFLIAEYQPFSHGERILNMMLNSATRKLYVSSRRAVAQVDLERCQLYGDLCQDCILARDPYCGWNGTHCIPATTVPLSSKYYLRCPTKSNHAEYSWHHPGRTNSTPCVHKESQCLLLIESMSPEQEGTYSCVSEERGYRRTLAQYQLQVGSEAVQLTSFTLTWVCQIFILVQTLCG
ncbi:semaphorin-7A [Aplochiton taeniatus]